MVDSKKWLIYAVDQSKKSKEYRNFYLPMKNTEGTVKTYAYSLNRFMKFLVRKKKIPNTESFTKLIKYKTKPMIQFQKDWIFELSEGYDDEKPITSSAIRTMIFGVISFFEANEFDWNSKRVLKAIPSEDRILGGRLAATNDDAVNMLNSTTLLSEKALVHFIASTGIRPGAVADPILKIKHLESESDDCKSIKVYDESKEGYWAFLTPEASKAIELYLEQRKQNGEIITNDSPIFRNKITNKIIQLSPHAAQKIFYKLIKKGGIKRVKTGNRFDKAVVTMWRKRFNGVLKMDNDVNSNIAEKLMGHKKGLDGTYLAPTKEQCFAEFKKAIPELTIDSTERQKLEIEKQKQEITEIEEKNNQLNDQQKRIDKIEAELFIRKNFKLMH